MAVTSVAPKQRRIFAVWSRVNQAWLVIFGADVFSATVLGICPTKAEAKSAFGLTDKDFQ